VGQVTPEEYAAGMEQAGITPQQLVEAWAAENPNEQLMRNWLHLQHLNEVLADRENRQAQEQEQALQQAEQTARGWVAEDAREFGAAVHSDVVLVVVERGARRLCERVGAGGPHAGGDRCCLDAAVGP
jgi:hypothetical protein